MNIRCLMNIFQAKLAVNFFVFTCVISFMTYNFAAEMDCLNAKKCNEIAQIMLKQYPYDDVLKALINNDIQRVQQLQFDPNKSLLFRDMPHTKTKRIYVPYIGIAAMLSCWIYTDTGSGRHVKHAMKDMIKLLIKKGGFPGAVMMDAKGKDIKSILGITAMGNCPIHKLLNESLQQRYNGSIDMDEMFADAAKCQTDVAPLIKKYLKTAK